MLSIVNRSIVHLSHIHPINTPVSHLLLLFRGYEQPPDGNKEPKPCTNSKRTRTTNLIQNCTSNKTSEEQSKYCEDLMISRDDESLSE